MDNIKELLKLGAETQSNYDTAGREYKDYLYTYQSKQKLLKDKASEIKNEDSQQERSINEKVAELELKKAEYAKEKNSIPADGKILSGSDGIISAIKIENGIIRNI